ncbi:hypothetical protein ACIPEQ_13535 [Curtobacterium sp. NPDC087080]|uniref:hypothetical protein n=1 Tax=Curtobacterium sp. NPDC087080 TaxID=3363965 RepID=UPI003826E8A6
MKTALVLMACAFAVAIPRGLFGPPTIDGATFLVLVLALSSLAAYWRWSVAPRGDR